MFWRGVVLSLAAASLVGCASGRIAADYATVTQKVGPPKAGQARIVLLQEKASGLGYASCACDMKLDGDPMGRLKPGTYLYGDRPAGHHQLLAAETMFPGDSKRDITMESGRTYFFLARVSERHSTFTGMTVAGGGLAGMLVTLAVTSGSENPGPVGLFPLNEPGARATLAELQLPE
jgi:hypothetical protein